MSSFPNIAIIGSCVTRDAFSLAGQTSIRLHSYVARQTLANIGRPAISFEEDWYNSLNNFERMCVVSDLKKSDIFWRFKHGADFLILDFIDERFDLFTVEQGLANMTKHLLQPLFKDRHYKSSTIVKRLSPEATALWKDGATKFLLTVLEYFPPERIILHEARWAPCFRHIDGSFSDFGRPHSELVEQSNLMLQSYYNIVTSLLPDVVRLTPRAKTIYADPNHKWSKEPFHYVQDYYEEFMSRLIEVVAGR